MSDATLNRDEVSAVRALVRDLGLTLAAERLGVSPSTLSVILSGRQPRTNTVAVLRTNIPKVRA
jgi:DNA-binding transcriptional LysR family regulator